RSVRHIERAHQVNLDDGLEGLDAHTVKDGVAQDSSVVDHAVQLAETVDRGLDDLAGRDRLGHGLEIRYRRAAALPDLLDDLFGRCRAGAGAVGSPAGIVDYHPGAFSGA